MTCADMTPTVIRKLKSATVERRQLFAKFNSMEFSIL